MSEQQRFIVLMSKGVSDRFQGTNQSRALTILNGQKVPFTVVDGMDPEQLKKRDELFAISKIRGNYPQFFFVQENGSTTYFGNFEKLDNLNEVSESFNEIFASVVETF
mmetsp:Transcript_40439/g.47318  ORF Transcript_40439/g.47318 Transcript_40439/m.47318 type:complete len:108 (-) Transcript_40439:211-534(-)